MWMVIPPCRPALGWRCRFCRCAPAREIGMQKTGYLSEAGKCLVMQARIESRTMIIILHDASGAQSRFADAQRLRRWMTEQLRLDPTLVQAQARS